MREISKQAVRMFVDRALEVGVPLEALVEGLPIGVAHLLSADRIDWEHFAALHDNLARLLEPRGMTLESFGAGIVSVPAYDALRVLARRVASTRELYLVAIRWIAPAIFPHMPPTARALPGGRLLVEGELAPHDREGTSFFRVVVGATAALPRLCDLPDAQMVVDLAPRRLRMFVTPPEDPSRLGVVRRFVRSLLRDRAALATLLSQRAELDASMSALARTRRDFRDVLDRIPACVGVHRSGVFVWGNRAFAEMIRVSPDRLVGTRLLALVHPDERATVAARLAVPPENTPPVQVTRLVRPDGTIALVEIAQTQTIEFDGAPARIVSGAEITERRRLEEQLLLADRMASLGMVAAGVGHEINNPLTYASVQVELADRALARASGPESIVAARASLAIAREGLERVRGIVTDLRAFSRADDEVFAAIDVRDVVRSTLTLAKAELSQRARIVEELGPCPRVRGNHARLGQVVLNLLVNAVEAIPEGDPERHSIRVRCASDSPGVVIEIADSGAGIPPRIAPRLFEPFFTTKPLGKGTGLGLAICHSVVTRLGGEIRLLEHEPLPIGAGLHPIRTTFRIRLPVANGGPLH